MRKGAPLHKVFLAIVVAGILMLAAMAFQMQRSESQASDATTRESYLWSALQIETELHKLIGVLGRLGAGDQSISADDVRERFDILWSRASLFQSGEVGAYLSQYDRTGGAIEAVFRTLREQEPVVMALRAGDRAEIISLLVAFGFHQPRLKALSVAVNAGEIEKMAIHHAHMAEGRRLTAALSFGIILMAGLIVAFAYADTRRSRRDAEDQRRLTLEAEAANRAKARFLSMMSHELRTPMNGVLGQLALAKLPGLPPSQMRLIEQAERSGRQLIGMLVDIIDFAALQEHKLVAVVEPFDVREFSTAIEQSAQRPMAGEAAQLAVEVAERVPSRVIGDASRLRQAIVHLALYIADTAGTRNSRLLFDYAEGELCATLSFLYDDAASGEWRPDLILGDDQNDDTQLDTDALGPVIARGLIEMLGGRLELTELYAGQTAITIFVPAEAIAEIRPKVALETQSATMSLVCAAALKGADIELVQPDAQDEDITIALVEACGRESERLEAVRKRHPNAKVVALGRPESPSDFDAVAPLPLEVNALRDVIFRQIA